MRGKEKKKSTPAPLHSFDNVVVPKPYTQVPLLPLVPLSPVAAVEEHPDVDVTRRLTSPFHTATMRLAASPYSQASQSHPVASPYPVFQGTWNSRLPTEGTLLSYPLTLSNPLTQGS